MPNNPDAYSREEGLRVCKKRCDQCLFSSAKIVADERRDEVLDSCSHTGRYFICHKTQTTDRPAVCRGFYDEHPNRATHVARRLGIVRFV